MTLADLMGADAGRHGAIVVRGLTLDSRDVRDGDAFVALKGATAHGITFAPAALARGASVVLAESPAPPAFSTLEPVVWLDGLRERAGAIAARFHGEPSRSLALVGVTGTNGKTSTVQLLAQALTLLDATAATIGTLGAGLHGQVIEGERTTPDAIRLQALLAQFRDAGAGYVAMEVSSHALEQGRVNAVGFAVAVFTNLSRDHLDYHGTMEAYGAAKAKLFAWPGLAHAIVNIDDAFGRTLTAGIGGGVEVVTTGVDSTDAMVRATNVVTSTAGIAFDLVTPWGSERVTTRLLGRFNVANLLGVIATLAALGFEFGAIVSTVAQLEPVAGRMNRLGGDAHLPLVVVDYSHTPDSLEQALANLRAHCDGTLYCVFGCGGDRDAGKRPIMGAIAEKLADVAIVTDDNPRSEDGDAIAAAVVGGFVDKSRAIVERDRAKAIARAVSAAKAGDVVLIAGKGHEPYQEIAGRKLPFDDLDHARRALEAHA
ncbi:MAG TPA: UDP-N-acetylmuramoyl-L-alanyl-D-glutamate--2,6-diaminopimelate ligase [Tahibacter sp.]|nr:UDP-N-acetylmuramoyl-L-alanyl-D-glutamate--2,6-diaminopimelate ligase [Tahibacter sp.]